MTGPDDPDGTEDPRRRERDTEPIPRTPRDPGPSDDDTHFVGRAPLGAEEAAAASGSGPMGSAPPRSGRDEMPEFSEDEISGLGGVPINPRRVLPLEDE